MAARRFWAEGVFEDDTYQPDGHMPPFVVFDVDRQDNLPVHFPRRWQASVVAWLLNHFAEPFTPQGK